MDPISSYNASRDFTYNLKESRLRKCVELMSGLHPGKLLDIGCTNGDWALFWRERGWNSSGIDINHEDVNTARQRGIDAKYCDLNHDPFPFPDAYFDLVFAGEVIEHLIDTDRFLTEISRCLNPGGHVLITTPNLASFENRVRLALGVYPKWLNYNLEGSGHVRLYTLGVLKNQLAAHGFSTVRTRGNWVPFIPQHLVDDVKLPMLAITGDIFPTLAMDILVLARKLTGSH
ncbi:MAG TPA: class I SAM-dependent methyltransferase [Bacteroidota bacterium]|nr:class I SAM-dependent methyltransferase [Bacteroidota bacterium]